MQQRLKSHSGIKQMEDSASHAKAPDPYKEEGN